MESYARIFSEQQTTFKVEVKRADKRYPLTSKEIAADIGGYLLEKMENLTVDVHKPDVILRVELRNDAYVFQKLLKHLVACQQVLLEKEFLYYLVELTALLQHGLWQKEVLL